MEATERRPSKNGVGDDEETSRVDTGKEAGVGPVETRIRGGDPSWEDGTAVSRRSTGWDPDEMAKAEGRFPMTENGESTAGKISEINRTADDVFDGICCWNERKKGSRIIIDDTECNAQPITKRQN
jgi:hypothetical protein